MQQPTTWWQPLLEWGAANAPIFAGLGIVWKSIDRGFKYMSDAREEKISSLIEQKMANKVAPEIKKLSDSIDELKQAIWELKR